eukprot:915815-Pleurochrysis_carterae.AAC.3
MLAHTPRVLCSGSAWTRALRPLCPPPVASAREAETPRRGRREGYLGCLEKDAAVRARLLEDACARGVRKKSAQGRDGRWRELLLRQNVSVLTAGERRGRGGRC